MTRARGSLTTRARAIFLSSLATRLVKPLEMRLTSREVSAPSLVRVPTRHGDVRCFVTRPAHGAPLTMRTPAPPVVINLHGGGFLVGAPRQDERVVEAIAGEVGAFVVNVDYSTAPRARFPQAVEECFDVLRWVAGAGARTGWDPERIAFSGTSAGGNLALGALTLSAREHGPRARAAALTVPAVDQTVPPDVKTSPLAKPFVGEALLRTVNASYFRDDREAADPLASPILLGDELASLPPLLVMSAELDTFRPFIADFVVKARAHGVDVTEHCFEAVDHDFSQNKATSKEMMTTYVTLIREHLLEHLA